MHFFIFSFKQKAKMTIVARTLQELQFSSVQFSSVSAVWTNLNTHSHCTRVATTAPRSP